MISWLIYDVLRCIMLCIIYNSNIVNSRMVFPFPLLDKFKFYELELINMGVVIKKVVFGRKPRMRYKPKRVYIYKRKIR